MQLVFILTKASEAWIGEPTLETTEKIRLKKPFILSYDATGSPILGINYLPQFDIQAYRAGVEVELLKVNAEYTAYVSEGLLYDMYMETRENFEKTAD